MKRLTLFAVLLLAVPLRSAETGDVIRCAADLCAATYSERLQLGRLFAFTASVAVARCDMANSLIALSDSSGSMVVAQDKANCPAAFAAGDRVAVEGRVAEDAYGNPLARCERASLVSRGKPPVLGEITGDAFYSGALDGHAVRVSGIVSDAFVDEIGPDYMFLILNCNGVRIPVASDSGNRSAADFEALIGRRLSLVGVCRPGMTGSRAQFGHNVRTSPDNIRFSTEDSGDPFDAPEISVRHPHLPEPAASHARSRIRGRVLTVWQGDTMLLKTASGQLSRVSVSNGRLPPCGETVEAVGFPETDLYHINLTRCLWRVVPDKIADPQKTMVTSPRRLLTDDHGRRHFNADCHGRKLRVRGLVRDVPSQITDSARMLLDCDGCLVPVDLSACRSPLADVRVGSLVQVDGICIMDTECRKPSSPFPHIREMFVSVPDPAGIRVLANPPWWTPEKLLVLIGGLLVLMCGSLAWNLSLKRIVNRKSRELKAEITARLASDLKSRERTRLAVELHDSIAQNLSGASMEIGSAIHLASVSPKDMLARLEIASRTLHACRDELRDCMWDLRSKALEDAEMNGAIRTTLMPYVSDVNLLVRFNVPRTRFSDNSAHAILRIVRELTLNAVRHGHATEIRIAGSLDEPRLLFSVQDNGSGFDPDDHLGVAQGHFGLQGVRERINRFGGTMNVVSSPGRGTKVTMSIDISLPDEEDKTSE